jgi:hypothetical protein
MTTAESLLICSALLVVVSAMGFVVTIGNAVSDWLDR